MSGSVLEDEFGSRLKSLRRRVRSHDRAVVLGFVCSLTPVFPLPFIGLTIGLLNRMVFKAGKITRFDYRLVQKGLLFASINSLISLLLIFLVFRLVDINNLRDVVMILPSYLMDIIKSALHKILPASGGVQV